MGYSRAGFDIVGVDHQRQPHYPFDFIRMDVFDYLNTTGVQDFSLVHASPPCQDHSSLRHRVGSHGTGHLLQDTFEFLNTSRVSWVIENVIGSRLEGLDPIVLCGSQFGLKVRRHRLFWSSEFLMQPQCRHKEQGTPVGCYGHGGGKSTRGTKGTADECRAALDIYWMNRDEMAQAIPPAYTEYIGSQLRSLL